MRPNITEVKSPKVEPVHPTVKTYLKGMKPLKPVNNFERKKLKGKGETSPKGQTSIFKRNG